MSTKALRIREESIKTNLSNYGSILAKCRKFHLEKEKEVANLSFKKC